MIKVYAQDGVLEIVVDDPERGNVVDLAWVADFEAALEGLDRTIGCVLVRAEGRNFGLGGDVTTFVGPDPAAAVGALVEGVHGVLAEVIRLDVPVVAAVQGWVAGVAFSLALTADIVIASDSARFKTAYTQIGLTPDGGMSWTLPRRVPHAVALDLLLTDRSIGSREALALGIASRVSSDEALVEDSRAVAARIASGPRTSQSEVKRLVRGGADLGFEEQLRQETTSITAASVTPDGLEGVRAFLERRPPRYAQSVAQTNETIEQY